MGFESVRSEDPRKKQEMPEMTPELQAELAEMYNVPLASKSEKVPETEIGRDHVRSMPIVTQEQLDALGFDYKINKSPEAENAVREEQVSVEEFESESKSETETERDTRFDVRSNSILTEEQVNAVPEAKPERDTRFDARIMPSIKPKKSIWQRVSGWFN